MNAKDQAAMDKFTASLKAEFEQALKDALAPFIITITELEQRSSNFAARVNASNKILRGEITALRSQIEALKPKAKAAPVTRLNDAEFHAACKALEAEDGKSFHHHSLVRAKAEEMRGEEACEF
jgi:mRNA-degrading endonuclease toxin of MazEF toxin-antitoxin module